MALADLLAQLRETFPAGSTTGTFDAGRVEGGRFAPLLASVGAPEVLALASPAGWLSDGSTISLTGRTQTPLLGLADAGIYLRFTPGSGGSGDYVLLIDVSLPAGWTFGRSFAALNAGVLAELAVADPEAHSARRSALLLASAPVPHPGRIVAGAALRVPAGLSFLGFFDADSAVLAEIAWITGGPPAEPVAGPVRYDSPTGAVEMDLPLARGSVTGLFGPTGPALDFAVTLHSGLGADGNYASGILFSTAISFGSTVELTALLSDRMDGVLELELSGSALALPDPATIATYFGAANGIIDALPGQFAGGNLVQVESLVIGIGLVSAEVGYAFLVLTGAPWRIWPGVIELSDVRLEFSIFEPMSDDATAAFALSGVFALGGVPLGVRAELPGTRLQANLAAEEPPDLAPLLSEVFGNDRGVPLSLTVGAVDFDADLGTKSYSAAIEIDGEWDVDFGLENSVTVEELRLELSHDPDTGPAGEISGAVMIGESRFSVVLDLARTGGRFAGAWENLGEPLTFQDIGIALGMYGLASLPEELDLGFTAASFAFETAGPSIEFTLSTNYGDAALLAGKDAAGAWGFVCGMIVGLDLQLTLTDIDVLGDLVPAGLDVLAVRDLRIVAATGAIPAFEQTPALHRILGDELSRGLVLSIALSVGGDNPVALTARFGGADDGTADDTPPDGTLATLEPAATPPGPLVAWINVQRAFGPAYFGRIGFTVGADGSGLGLILDASVMLAGLTVGLTGLRADIPLAPGDHVPRFSLSGLLVGYTAPGFSIAGGLAYAADTGEYSGQLIVRCGQFGATALGAYRMTGEEPSLFGFVFVDVPLGGPPFFYVTGLAGGFGYNRTLRLPAPDQVEAYPLVRGAMGELDAAETQQALQQYIVSAAGQNWIAFGVRFTSFQMLRSFVLLTVAFGTHVEIGLVGQSTLTIPSRGAGEQTPATAEADLQLVASLTPDNGQLAVQAQLTPRSYVLSQDARLTGGFAFFAWFGPSQVAGDFVVTLGGYHPLYIPPKHYPAVPRLGLNWQISPQMTVKGSLYFALTPSAIMAGGTLEATWRSGNVTAWLTADADFLIRFQPFSYSARLGISIGVSVVLIPGVTSSTITVRVGVDMNLWGPPFGGRCRIDIAIISITLEFGATEPAPPTDLDWPGFRESFLPPANPSERGGATLTGGSTAPPTALSASPAPAVGPTPTDGLITISAADGLRGTTSVAELADLADLADLAGLADLTGADGTIWLVEPSALRLTVDVRVPCKAATVIAGTERVPRGQWNTDFGIGPMGVAPGELDVRLRITIAQAGPADSWAATALLGDVPTGLWLDRGAVMRQDGLVHHVMTGVELRPVPPEPGATVQLPVIRLIADDPLRVDAAWSDAAVPDSDPFDQDHAITELQRTLVDRGVADRRTALLNALADQGLGTARTVNVDRFAAAAADLLAGPPRLRLLGEVPGRSGAPGQAGEPGPATGGQP